jgi:hypothetical protein
MSPYHHTKIWAAVTLALAATALVGCAPAPHVEGSQQVVDNSGYLYEAHKTLADGRTVTCVIYAYGYKGGLSCDWDGAR